MRTSRDMRSFKPRVPAGSPRGGSDSADTSPSPSRSARRLGRGLARAACTGGPAQGLERELARGLIHRDRVLAGEARAAEARAVALAGEQSLDREITERVHAQKLADALDAALGA